MAGRPLWVADPDGLPPGKLCNWPEEPPGSGRFGCGAYVWFRRTGRRRASSGGVGIDVFQVVNALGVDHHTDCSAWLAKLARERREREQAAAALAADRPTLF
jgi:hypothetical protein